MADVLDELVSSINQLNILSVQRIIQKNLDDHGRFTRDLNNIIDFGRYNISGCLLHQYITITPPKLIQKKLKTYHGICSH